MGVHTYFKSLSKLERMYRCPGEFQFEQHNVASHSWKVTQYAQFFGEVEAKNGATIDWKSLYEKALNHDYPEIFIGDIKTPVKYASPELREMIAKVEEGMTETFVKEEFPEEFQAIYHEKLKEGKDGSTEGMILELADKLDQLYESYAEIQRGNTDEVFVNIYRKAIIKIKNIPLYSVEYFLNNILPEMLEEKSNSMVDIKQITEEALAV
ncbi:hydrolase [Bacillus sp. M6-12]|uniref:YfbR-like 5'-deoxynucleotidase n=1 Tax=Bacillus sp. M6-12 TaxID=2054166 RepID=UPI000C77CD29|nr:YfbR-like 5'-deoxynucleotidase [Bacillus sp. M6-12]PLS19214.1 hydrolase [Bacillus sp. M6-12]